MAEQKDCSDNSTGYHHCLIPKTHRRLVEAHVIWHQALSNYHEPDAFRANLNSALEAFRNVTWVLQKEKHSFPEFDRWYSPWQARLKEHPTAKWSAAARTTVVHKGELETSSSAVVRLLTWREDVLLEVSVPPDLPSSMLATNLPLIALLGNAKIPPEVVKDSALTIERRWSVEDLNGQEVLEALAQVYGLLSDLVLDAHIHLGASACIPHEPVHPDFRTRYERTGTLNCMVIGLHERTEKFEPSTRKPLLLSTQPIVRESDPARLAKVAARYGLADKTRLTHSQASDPIHVAQKLR